VVGVIFMHEPSVGIRRRVEGLVRVFGELLPGLERAEFAGRDHDERLTLHFGGRTLTLLANLDRGRGCGEAWLDAMLSKGD